MEIPDISIPDIYIPDVPEPYTPHYLSITKPPEIDVPGCTYQHRDIKNTGNRNLLLEDPNGVFTTCDFPFPGFVPLDYTPENMVITEEAPISNDPPPLPDTEQPKIPDLPEPPPPDFPPCPGKTEQRVGDFRNEKRLERVIGHERGQDGIECITLYESVPFVDSFLPSPSAAINVVTISLLAASSPLLLGVLKSLSKTVFKKVLTKSKKDKST
jgi:hypothetical protein